jgi:uncharacterized repeat protein (TIGR04138 family)
MRGRTHGSRRRQPAVARPDDPRPAPTIHALEFLMPSFFRGLARVIGLIQPEATKVEVLCLKCRYDLQGLPVQGPCPQCGMPVLQSVLARVPLMAEDATGDPREHPSRKPFEFVREQLGYPVDALLFVDDVVTLTSRRKEEHEGPPSQQRTPPRVTADEIIETLRAYALHHFGDAAESRAVLTDWNVRRSEDVAKIIEVLKNAKLLRATVRDVEQQFAGRFEVEKLFDAAGGE